MFGFILSLQLTELHTQEQIDDFLKQNENVLLVFTRSSCGHCKRLRPRLVDMEDLDEFKQLNVSIAKFSCDDNRVCHDLNVTLVPTIQLYKNNEMISSYEKAYREVKPIMRWLKGNLLNQNDNNQTEVKNEL